MALAVSLPLDSVKALWLDMSMAETTTFRITSVTGINAKTTNRGTLMDWMVEIAESGGFRCPRNMGEFIREAERKGYAERCGGKIALEVVK